MLRPNARVSNLDRFKSAKSGLKYFLNAKSDGYVYVKVTAVLIRASWTVFRTSGLPSRIHIHQTSHSGNI